MLFVLTQRKAHRDWRRGMLGFPPLLLHRLGRFLGVVALSMTAERFPFVQAFALFYYALWHCFRFLSR